MMNKGSMSVFPRLFGLNLSILMFLTALILIFPVSTFADTRIFSISQLDTLEDLHWNDNTVNYQYDIAGDPCYLYNVTIDRTGDEGGWDSLAIGRNGSNGLSAGDTWRIAIYNPNAYRFWIQPFYQYYDGVDDWIWDSDVSGWVNPGSTIVFDTIIDPGAVSIRQVGFQVGEDNYSGVPLVYTCDVIVTIPEVEITSMSQNSGSIGRYEKFEATFTLSQVYGNPFDPNIIDATATFHAPDESTIMMPAFYYRDYDIVGENPETIQNPGPEQWKVRYAPAQLGTYTYDLTIVTQTDTLIESSAGTFECVESSHRGFIRTDPCEPAFMAWDDGTTHINIGHDVCWAEGGIYGWNNYLTQMGNAGENWTRLWMCPWATPGGALLENNAGDSTGYYEGPGKFSTQVALRLDHFFDIAEQTGVAIQLCMQYHGQFSTSTNANWDYHPYNSANSEGFLDTAEEFFTDAQAIQMTKNKYRYIIARWGYSPAVFAWELFNEVQYTDGWQNAPSTVVDWHEEMADYINSIDPINHPITTSSHGSGFDALWSLENIDLIQVHNYGGNQIRFFESLAQILAGYGKTVIMGEFGAGSTEGVDVPEADPGALPEPYQTQMYEALMLHNGVWSSFHVKSSAHLWWWDYYIDPLDLYGEFTPLAKYTEGENLSHYGLTRTPRAVAGNEAIYATPLIGDFWGVTTQTVFTLDEDYFPGMENISRWLHGTWKSAYRSDPNFILEMPTTGVLKIHVEQVANSGSNSIQVLVNGDEVFSQVFVNGSTKFFVEVPLPA
ncbi:MAG: DUF5060 domain-containing protein, partial [Sedimentisphaerales bacterium]|nr:DUF5060 domain-containing protein [Sedimentisphaerales bacterium]